MSVSFLFLRLFFQLILTKAFLMVQKTRNHDLTQKRFIYFRSVVFFVVLRVIFIL
jgi:hypothetical protein